MITVNVDAIREAAAYRPDGYVEDVLSSGTIAGNFVLIPDAVFDALMVKYAGCKRPCGPGCQLKRLLSRLGLSSQPGCKCEAHAAVMDLWGADECSKPERISEIMGWLKEEAEHRGMPFLELPARMLINRAIHLARHHLDA